MYTIHTHRSNISTTFKGQPAKSKFKKLNAAITQTAYVANEHISACLPEHHAIKHLSIIVVDVFKHQCCRIRNKSTVTPMLQLRGKITLVIRIVL